MTKTVPSKDYWDRDVNVKLLPVAWTVSLEILMNRIMLLDAKLQQYPNDFDQTLAKEGLTAKEYAELKQSYAQLLNAINNSATIQNPNYKPEEKK
jgi:hypothetical protein